MLIYLFKIDIFSRRCPPVLGRPEPQGGCGSGMPRKALGRPGPQVAVVAARPKVFASPPQRLWVSWGPVTRGLPPPPLEAGQLLSEFARRQWPIRWGGVGAVFGVPGVVSWPLVLVPGPCLGRSAAGATWISFACPLGGQSYLHFCAHYFDMPDDGSGKPRAHVRYD